MATQEKGDKVRWEFSQQDGEYRDYQLFLPDVNAHGGRLTLTLNTKKRTAQVVLALDNQDGRNFAERGVDVPLDWAEAITEGVDGFTVPDPSLSNGADAVIITFKTGGKRVVNVVCPRCDGGGDEPGAPDGALCVECKGRTFIPLAKLRLTPLLKAALREFAALVNDFTFPPHLRRRLPSLESRGLVEEPGGEGRWVLTELGERVLAALGHEEA